MAFGGGSYLPDVGSCLNGGDLVLSWDDLLLPLLAHNTRSSYPYTSIFSDSKIKSLLSQAIPEFPAPSTQARTSFDTRTAAINVSPTVSPDYDIEQIKSDALWLSKEVDVDELEALRVTLSEWQTRSKLRLRCGFSDVELASIRDAFGGNPGGTLSGGLLNRSDSEFDTDDGRKCRLISVYFEEQVRLLSVSLQLIEIAILRGMDEAFYPDSSLASVLDGFPAESLQSLVKTLEDSISFVQKRIRNLENVRNWSVSEQYQIVLSARYTTYQLQAIALAFQILLLRIRRSKVTVPAETIVSWNQLLASIDYFAAFQSEVEAQQIAILHIQSTAVSISLALLDASSVVASLADDAGDESFESASIARQDYFTDVDAMVEINDFMLSAARSCNGLASPGVLSWGLILLELRRIATSTKEARESHSVQRALDAATSLDITTGRRLSVSSSGSLQQSKFEELIDRICSTSFLDDPITYMLDCAIQGSRAFDQICRFSLEAVEHPSVLNAFKQQIYQDLIAASLPALGYSPDIVATQLAILSSPQAWRHLPEILQPDLNLLQDNFLLDNIFDVAAARFPYEALPFLKLCKSLAFTNVFDDEGVQYITFRLKQLDSFTQAAVKGFTSYDTIREDENANLVVLGHPVNLLNSMHERSLATIQHQSEALPIMPAETIGEVISESNPPVVKWQFKYSCLGVLGKLVELHYLGLLSTALSPFEDPEEVVVEVIDLLATLLHSTFDYVNKTRNEDVARQVCEALLSETSRSLPQDSDVASFVLEILEQGLQPLRQRARNVYGRELLKTCVKFSTALSRFRPVQVWSGIAKSSLFGNGGTGASFLNIVVATEVPNQEFELLEACTRFYEVLLDLALTVTLPSAHSSRIQPTLSKPTTRAASQRISSSIVLSCTETIVGAFMSIPTWTFRDHHQKSIINRSIANAFSKILRIGLGVGVASNATIGISTIYLASAKYLTHALRGSDSVDADPGPIAHILTSIMVSDDFEGPCEDNRLPELQPLLSLGSLLIDSGLLLNFPVALLEKQILNIFPVIIRFPMLCPASSIETYILLRKTLQVYEAEMPCSLLGHLGSVSTISFLEFLKQVERISLDSSTVSELWKLLSCFVTHKQQWLATLVLTGSIPDTGRQINQLSPNRIRGKPILTVALDSLTSTNTLGPKTLASTLKFLTQAQQSWPSVTDAITARKELFSTLISRVIETNSSQDDLEVAQRNMIAAFVTQLSTTHIHQFVYHRNSVGLKTFIPLVNWLTTNALDVSSYNASLHANLKKNFTMKYAGLEIIEFKRTELIDPHYGPSYYYDHELAQEAIGNDPFWESEKASNQGFSAEIKRANINLSLVDSELVLLQSFKHMCLEHCAFFVRDRETQKTMGHIVKQCLLANTRTYPADKLFETLFQSRADLAVLLLRQLVAVGARGSEFTTLLETAWTTACFRSGSYALAIMNDDLVYWRSMLTVLLLSMRLHVEKKLRVIASDATARLPISQIDSTNSLILEITSLVIGEGLRSIVHTLNTDQRSMMVSVDSISGVEVGIKDVSLILSLLQTILRLPALPQILTQLADRLISTDVGRSCLLLYSWSHLLAQEDSNSAYADISLQLMVSLSSLGPVAEEMAVEGIFNSILTAKITQYLQSLPGGAAPMDKRPEGKYLYKIWATGLLPLCLNLIHAVGGGIVGEASAYLNQFPQQLTRASLAFSISPEKRAAGGEVLTLGLATEVATVSLISFILQSFREAGASAGIDPQSVMPLIGFDEHKKALTDDIRDVLQQNQVDRRRRTLAVTEKEALWQKSPDNTLDTKLLQQLRQAISCLQQQDDEDGQ